MVIRWSKKIGNLPDPSRCRDDFQGTLIITEVRIEDGGTYVCSVSDGVNVWTNEAVITIDSSVVQQPEPPSPEGGRPPRLDIQPRSLQVREGDEVEMLCNAQGTPPVMVQWLKDGQAVTTSARLFLASVRKEDEGEYTCRAVNSYGFFELGAVIYVEAQGNKSVDSLL